MKKVLFGFLALGLAFGFLQADAKMYVSGDVKVGIRSFSFTVRNANIPHDQVRQVSHKPFIACDHNLSGFVEFESSYHVKYHAYSKLRKGVTYHCSFVDGGNTFSFKSLDFGLLSASIDLKNKVAVITFSDKVSKDEFLKHVKFEKIEKLSHSPLSYSIEDSDGRTFVLRLNEDAQKISVLIPTSLKSIYGVKLAEELKGELEEQDEDKKRPSFTRTKRTKYISFQGQEKTLVADTNKDGSIKLRLFTKKYFSSDDNVRKFIRINGFKDFTTSDARYVYGNERKKYGLSTSGSLYAIDLIGDFKANTQYDVTILRGFGDRYNQLDTDESFEVKTSDFGSHVDFIDKQKPYISSNGEIGLKSINVNEIQVIIDKMSEQNLRYYMNFDNNKDVSTFSEQMLSKKFSLGGKKNEYSYHKINLKNALKGLSKGVYKISVHYGKKGKYASKVIFLSDIGLGAKVYKDGIFVWTASLSDTDAFKGAKVEVYSDKNILLAEGRTNWNGVYEFKQKDFLSKHPKSVLVTSMGEQNFLVLNNSVDGKRLSDLEDGSKVHVFSYLQSKLLRPEQDLNALVMLKDDEFKAITNAPLLVKLKNAEGKYIYKNSHKSNENGLLRLNIPLHNQKTGRFRLEIYYADKLKSVKTFMVEAFLPQKITTKLSLSKGVVWANSYLDVNVSTRYTFGSVASKLKAIAKFKMVDKTYTNPKYKNYTFTDTVTRKAYRNGEKESNNQLDSKGELKLAFSTSLNSYPRSMLHGQVEVGVFDDGRRNSVYKGVDIYVYKKMVGLHLKKDIVDTQTPIELTNVLINPVTSKKQDGNLKAYIFEKKWSYTYDTRGHYKWHKELVEVGYFDFKANTKITRLFPKSGDYVISVNEPLGDHIASIDFSVRGWDYANISPSEQIAKNEVSFVNKLYKRGDTVELDIKSPIKKGKMLITLEGEGVHWYKSVEFSNARLKVDVPLDVDLGRGLYIHTIAVRDTKTKSALTPFRAYSSSFIKPDRTRYKLKPELIAPKISKSNNKIEIKVKAKKGSQVLVSLVDDGILQILGQKPPRLFDFFNKFAKDKIVDFDIYDELLAQFAKGSVLKFGSGDDVAELNAKRKHQAPTTGAVRVKPFVYFSPLLEVKDGYAKTSLQVPSSYAGSATIVAIEVGKNAIGSTSAKLVVKDDVIIKPIAPRFGNVGDEWDVKVRLFNTTDKEIKLKLSSKAKKLKVQGFDKELTLKPNASKLLNAQVKVLETGKGELEFLAASDKQNYSYKVELPLIQPYPLSTHNEQGSSKDKLKFSVPSAYKNGTYRLSVSGDPLERLRGGMEYLLNYPYGCAEQTSSKLLALLNLPPFLDTHNQKQKEVELKNREKFINEGIHKLSSMQKSDGRFAYWEEGGYVVKYASIYASDVLFELKNASFDVPEHVSKGIIKSLKNYTRDRDISDSDEDAFNYLYAMYVLATKGVVDISDVNYFYDSYKGSLSDLTSLYVFAYVLKTARMDSEANAMLKRAKKFNLQAIKRVRRYGGYFYSRPRDLAFALYLHVKHFGKDKRADELLRLVKKEFKHLYSTQDKAFALRALREYYKGYNPGKTSFIVKTKNNEKKYSKKAYMSGKLGDASLELIPQGSYLNYDFSAYEYLPLKIKNDKDFENPRKSLDLYRTFTGKKQKKINLKLKEGKSIFAYTDGEEVDLQNLKLGSTIYSNVHVLAGEDLENVVINEQIPSCFEVDIKKLRQNANKALNFIDIRDDRVIRFFDLKFGKKISFRTPLKVSIKGECKLPPVLGELMYNESINDYALEAKNVKVK